MSEKAFTTVTVAVNHEHEFYGTPQDCGTCAVALALNDVVKPEFYTYVDNTVVEVYDDAGNSVYEGPLPDDAQRMVWNYDNGLPLEGREFSIRLPLEIVDNETV